MKKINNIFAFAIIALLIYSCGSSSTSIEDFDHEAQALIDNDTLTQFLENHYYDAAVDSVKVIESGQVPLSDIVSSMSVTENDIDYTLYYYIKNVGTPAVDKGYPTVMDSVFVKYYGQAIVTTESLSTAFDSNDNTWFTLNGVIRGWAHGFTKFKGGNNITNNGPITFENGGKGLLFIPSGLAYGNTGSGTGDVIANECLVFNIELYDFVKDTDHDNDGVASIFEDPDGNGDPRDDDTDEDGVPNFFDSDDDGDAVLTKNEDANGDGNPANDFSDPSNPTLADYLNSDIK
ncbi:FKBP-type peptidyl-prolyl cis-trans isomerase [Polaribacter sp. Z022]|uniref:FKBP-type peptidyl-prolyl cis-trans isomerase n=1 Tax=Polaribacter sp. Z022 TaxID=2927125 RepID=UPI0020226E1F|nr:FKBP-type peptidyl-prolyl cis-trans isomerase [Polaribacter sp. Z022]MCL7754909.1 FKBP-type peptidyl-prolyl cis-trans isomerase [Polaribacter sp. Z022]